MRQVMAQRSEQQACELTSARRSHDDEVGTPWPPRGSRMHTRLCTGPVPLAARGRTWITNRNDQPKPFVWHKSGYETLDSLANYCNRISDSGH